MTTGGDEEEDGDDETWVLAGAFAIDLVASSSYADVDAAEIDELLAQRNAARAAKDFAEADRIRDQLAGMGIVIEDGPDGSRWKRTDV